MTQITIAQWLSNNTNINVQEAPMPRYQIVNSKKFYGHYDVLDTHTGKREACGNLRTARATIAALNK